MGARMNALEKLTGALAIFFMLLNLLGGVVAGIWLAVLGEWGTLFRGLGILIGGALTISLFMMPGLLLAAPAASLHTSGKRLGFYFFGLMSLLYTYGVLAGWCVLVLLYFLNRADSASEIP